MPVMSLALRVGRGRVKSGFEASSHKERGSRSQSHRKAKARCPALLELLSASRKVCEGGGGGVEVGLESIEKVKQR